MRRAISVEPGNQGPRFRGSSARAPTWGPAPWQWRPVASGHPAPDCCLQHDGQGRHSPGIQIVKMWIARFGQGQKRPKGDQCCVVLGSFEGILHTHRFGSSSGSVSNSNQHFLCPCRHPTFSLNFPHCVQGGQHI